MIPWKSSCISISRMTKKRDYHFEKKATHQHTHTHTHTQAQLNFLRHSIIINEMEIDLVWPCQLNCSNKKKLKPFRQLIVGVVDIY